MSDEPNKDIAQKLLNTFNQKKYKSLSNSISDLQNEYPYSIFLLNLLGATQLQLNNYDYAIECYNKIIDLNKNFADAYYNLAIIYKEQNNTKESIKNYNKCIKINPKKFEAYNNLGNIYKDNNETEKAIENYLQSLEINSNYLIALQNFGVCLQSYNFKTRSLKVDKQIFNLLEKNNILRPVDISNSVINYLYLSPEFKEIIDNVKNLEKKFLLETLLNRIFDSKILISLMKITPITDLKIEIILKYIRRKILLNINSMNKNNIAIFVMNAIAQQCFINEYIYSVDPEEEETLKIIEKKVSINIKKEDYNNILEICCLAAYKQLNTFSWSNKILFKKALQDLVENQINNPKIETKIAKNIISKEINNFVSVKVKKQYERNPYPRWTKIALNNNPRSVSKFVQIYNLNANSKVLNKWNDINILVAGCGTGQHAINTATKFKNSFVTAIDLSLKSLSYAKRKADELQIKNIEFIEMDILNLKNLNKKFEIIESVGVLHHMSNPLKGWEILSKILKPHGLMMIGLYSARARKHITKIRSKFKNLDKYSNDYLKILREKIILNKNNDFNLIKQSSDFYSLSSLRDLIFHTHEYTFNIKELDKNIKKLNLKFCGFENKHIINLFKNQFTANSLYDLNTWHKFEKNNPRIFAGMYQFWCQKIK